MKILVVYNGTLSAQAALRQGIRKARERRAALVVLYVFNRNLFIDYDAGPRAEVIARNESVKHVEEAQRILDEEGSDIRKRIVVIEGRPEEEIIRFAKQERVDIIVSPQRYDAIARTSTCPVYLIPPALSTAAL